MCGWFIERGAPGFYCLVSKGEYTHTHRQYFILWDRSSYAHHWSETLQQEGKGIRFAALEMVVWLLTFWEGGVAKHKKSITHSQSTARKKQKKMRCSYAVDAGVGGEGSRWWGKAEERGHPGGERKEINCVSVAAYAFLRVGLGSSPAMAWLLLIKILLSALALGWAGTGMGTSSEWKSVTFSVARIIADLFENLKRHRLRLLKNRLKCFRDFL